MIVCVWEGTVLGWGMPRERLFFDDCVCVGRDCVRVGYAEGRESLVVVVVVFGKKKRCVWVCWVGYAEG